MSTSCADAFRRIQEPHGVPWHGRRQFLQTLVWGGGAACLTVLGPVADLRAAGQTDALLLSCMDFRLLDNTHATWPAVA